MTTHSEDVLQSVSHVRHKKQDGTLYIMPERVAWMPNGKDKITLSIKYSDIKTQKISAEGKPKIQLQLVLHSGEAPTFHFASPAGTATQLSNRSDVKELLQQLLPKFKARLSEDMAEKQKLLQENPQLFQLYKDLVTSQIITAEEFWGQVVASRLDPDQVMMKSIRDLVTAASFRENQRVGISPAFLSGIKAQADGCNGVRYNITNDIIEAIFRTYPAVKRKHFENVPHKMTDNEFWTRFFQSHYFHRDRVFAGSSGNKSDFFAECARIDEASMSEAAKQGVDDPFVDLSAFLDDDYVDTSTDNLLPTPSFSQTGDKKQSKTKDKDRERLDTTSSIQNPNQALIKRFNHHSIMVLDACLSQADRQKHPVTNGTQEVVNGKQLSSAQKSSASTPTPEDDVIRKKSKLNEKTDLADLSGQVMDPMEWMCSGSKELQITHKERYLVGPTPLHANPDIRSEDVRKAVEARSADLSRWKPKLRDCLTPVNALAALNELRAGGSLMKVDTSVELKLSVPAEVQKELKNIYLAGNELLRHFWSCFPVTSEKLADKLVQMKVTLEKFESTKLVPLQQKLQKEHFNPELAVHLSFQLKRAFERFTGWQAKRGKNPLQRKNSTSSNSST